MTFEALTLRLPLRSLMRDKFAASEFADCVFWSKAVGVRKRSFDSRFVHVSPKRGVMRA